MPRSAVKVSQSPFARVCELQQRALDLEKKLTDAAGAAAASHKDGGYTDAYDQWRGPLCEVLGDMVLTDPAFALKKQVLARLWRHCFYSRIAPQRSRIAKEKQRQQQKQRKQGHQQQPAASSSLNLVAKMEQNLLQSLAEAITLYMYFAERLLAKLTGEDESTQSQQDETQESQAVASTSTEGVVECLYHVYISLGDLYRYSHQMSKAEQAYTLARRLGYGHGHGYNQLAVLCQVPPPTQQQQQQQAPQSAVALYWYARALLVTTQDAAFDLAHSNLSRLWTSNRSWVRKHLQHGGGATSSKSMQSRLFLAQFVDLTYYWAIEEKQPGQEQPLPDMEVIQEAMKSMLDSFQALVENSSLSDALLCKLVTILAFGECLESQRRHHHHHQQQQQKQKEEQIKKDDEAPVPSGAAAPVASRTTSLAFGNCLADSVMAKLKKQQQQKKFPSSVRSLLPLLLLSEYLFAMDFPPGTLPVSTDTNLCEWYGRGYQSFWSKTAELLNELQALSVMFEQEPRQDASTVRAAEMLQEYQNLRGYQPFQEFCQKSSESGFLLDAEAITLLQKHLSEASQQQYSGGQSLTQESTLASSSSLGAKSINAEQTRLKIIRFLQLGRSIADSTKVGIERTNDGTYKYEVEQADDDAAMDNEDWTEVVQKDEGGGENFADDQDVLVYKQAVNGGPALLMPGALLQEQAGNIAVASSNALPPASIKVVKSPADSGAGPMDVDIGANGPALATTGAALNLTSAFTPMGPKPPPPPPGLALDGVAPPPQPEVKSVPPPPPGFGGSDPLQNVQSPLPLFPRPGGAFHPAIPSNNAPSVPTVAESLGLLGDSSVIAQTANPFMSSSSSSRPGADADNLFQYGSSLLEPSMDAISFDLPDDGASFLDSGLLTSLWMDDSSKTKNPFASS